MVDHPDAAVFGQQLRYYRRKRGLTLAELGKAIGKSAPFLSMLENGKKEPRLTLISELATMLDVSADTLMSPEPPTERARLELGLERAQQDPIYAELGLPHLRPSAKTSDNALRHIVGLHRELSRRAGEGRALPEAVRSATNQLRLEMRQRDNYFPEIESIAAEAVSAAGYSGPGAVPQRMLTDLASHFGFTVYQDAEMPVGTRSITDERNRRIYIPQRNSLRTRAARSAILRALGHHALGHREPSDFGSFLRQRVEAAYFAGAVLVPEQSAVSFLLDAKADRDISVEDLKEVFYVSYEMAAHRLTNLATHHLELKVHFVRSDDTGTIWKAYENDGVPFPVGADGSIEGQRLCRHWGTRLAFNSPDRFAIHYQYTDTSEGRFWCTTHVEVGGSQGFAVTTGATFDDAQYFRGRNTDQYSASGCPEPSCCRRPVGELADRWAGVIRPEAIVQSNVLAVFPTGVFPGVDLNEVYEFLERNAPRP